MSPVAGTTARRAADIRARAVQLPADHVPRRRLLAGCAHVARLGPPGGEQRGPFERRADDEPLAVRGDAAHGGNDEVATSAEHAVWPRGCGAVYAEAVAAKPHRCMPDRFFFSFADGELPSKGHDLIHLHDVLNRTEPTASARRLGVPPLLAITPSMLFGGGFTPQPPGEAGRIVGDPAAYYAGALTFKMLGT